MAEAVERAAADAKLSGVPAADVVRVVSLLSWRYGDPAHFLAEQLGLSPRETAVTTPGGNSPQMLVNEAALEIQRGELDLAILAGGEAWRTRMRARKAGATLTLAQAPRRRPARPGHRPRAGHELAGRDGPGDRDARPGLPDVRDRGPGGRRAPTSDEHLVAVSELWSRFSVVAAGNPYAWSQQARTAEEIRTPGPTNRMIGLPYPKLMNSNNDVDQAAALLHVLGGAGALARHPRGPVGVPARGRRLPRAPLRLEPLVAGRHPGHPGGRSDACSSWPVWAWTTSRSSTSTRASRRRCSSARRRSASASTGS